MPIWASSPAACTAVVTSSVPLGGAAPDSSGSGASERARFVDSARAGAPARTGRGRCGSAGSRAGAVGVRGAGSVVVFLAVRGDFAAAFGFFAAGFVFVAEAAAVGFGFVFAPSRDRSARRPVGRVAGRVPRTPASSLRFGLIGIAQSTFHVSHLRGKRSMICETCRAARRKVGEQNLIRGRPMNDLLDSRLSFVRPTLETARARRLKLLENPFKPAAPVR